MTCIHADWSRLLRCSTPEGLDPHFLAVFLQGKHTKAGAVAGKGSRTRVSSHRVCPPRANTDPSSGENTSGRAGSPGGRGGRKEKAVDF